MHGVSSSVMRHERRPAVHAQRDCASHRGLFTRRGVAAARCGCVLSLDAVRNLLLEQSRVRLAITADDYAAALHDRLLAIDGRLDELAQAPISRSGTGKQATIG
jgi:hypothetical protein